MIRDQRLYLVTNDAFSEIRRATLRVLLVLGVQARAADPRE